MFWNLLEEASDGANQSGSRVGSYILIGVLVLAIVAFWIYNSKASKKQQKEAQAKLDAVKPGNKVTTIGGISGIVVEVSEEDGTFVLETGTEKSGKSYLKFIKQAIYETDAVVENGKESALKSEKTEQPEEDAFASVEQTENK